MGNDGEPNPALAQLFNEYHVGPYARQWENPDFVSEYGSGISRILLLQR